MKKKVKQAVYVRSQDIDSTLDIALVDIVVENMVKQAVYIISDNYFFPQLLWETGSSVALSLVRETHGHVWFSFYKSYCFTEMMYMV